MKTHQRAYAPGPRRPHPRPGATRTARRPGSAAARALGMLRRLGPGAAGACQTRTQLGLYMKTRSEGGGALPTGKLHLPIAKCLLVIMALCLMACDNFVRTAPLGRLAEDAKPNHSTLQLLCAGHLLFFEDRLHENQGTGFCQRLFDF